MTLLRHFKRMKIEVLDDSLLLHVGDMDIWDGADLALLREGLFKLIEKDGCRSIAIDMRYVKYIPSGFFGMLFDWHEKRGVRFQLTPPQPNVQRMLWFQRFFALNPAGRYELQPDSSPALDEVASSGVANPAIESAIEGSISAGKSVECLVTT